MWVVNASPASASPRELPVLGRHGEEQAEHHFHSGCLRVTFRESEPGSPSKEAPG